MCKFHPDDRDGVSLLLVVYDLDDWVLVRFQQRRWVDISRCFLVEIVKKLLHFRNDDRPHQVKVWFVSDSRNGCHLLVGHDSRLGRQLCLLGTHHSLSYFLVGQRRKLTVLQHIAICIGIEHFVDLSLIELQTVIVLSIDRV